MTRLGKIARLPREIRDVLNVRLQNGEVGRLLVDWLNGLPAAREALAANFGGRPISEQNLTEWKQGGYEDWVRHQENCAYAALVTEMSGDLEAEAGERRLEERLAAPLAVALARLLREAEEAPDGADRARMILDVARRLSQLRRDGFQAERLRLERERWEEKLSEICQKEHREAEEAAGNERIWEQTQAEFPHLNLGYLRPAAGLPPQEPRARGKAKAGRRRAKAAPEKSQSLGKEAVGDGAGAQPDSSSREGGLIDAAPGKSNQIKPDQTCQRGSTDAAGGTPTAASETLALPAKTPRIGAKSIKPDQAQSNRIKPAGRVNQTQSNLIKAVSGSGMAERN